MDFSGKLQKLRKSGGYSQEELANELNVSRQAISKWEQGTIPDINNLIAISKFFDCSLDYLLNDAYEEPKLIAREETVMQKKDFNVGVFLSVLGIALPLVIFAIIYVLSLVLDIRISYVIGGQELYYLGICGLIEKYSLASVIVFESVIYLGAYIWLARYVSKKRGYFTAERKKVFLCGVIMMSMLVIVSVYELVTAEYIILEPIMCVGISAYACCAVVLSFNIIGGKKSE